MYKNNGGGRLRIFEQLKLCRLNSSSMCGIEAGLQDHSSMKDFKLFRFGRHFIKMNNQNTKILMLLNVYFYFYYIL